MSNMLAIQIIWLRPSKQLVLITAPDLGLLQSNAQLLPHCAIPKQDWRKARSGNRSAFNDAVYYVADDIPKPRFDNC